jgi:hypothetical protein
MNSQNDEVSRRMSSKKFLALGPLIVAIVIISGCIGDMMWEFGHYDREIRRYYDASDEGMAIYHAENSINYTEYTNLTRWEGDWANFVDNEVIEHYNDSFVTDRDADREADVYFYYNAWARFYPELNFKMKNERYSLLIKLNNDNFIEGFEEPPFLDFEIEEMVIVHIDNGTWVFDKERWQTHYWESDFKVELYMNFTNVYFVAMELSYDDIWGPLAATYVQTAQFLILNEEFEPLVIGIAPSPWMVS